MTVKIHGKDYMEVNERLQIFRKDFPGHALVTEIYSMSDDRVVIKATISCEEKVIATGWAFEDINSSKINKTSFVENCETSAWGRALANFGIGLDTAISSAEEVRGGKGAEISLFEKWEIRCQEILDSSKTLEDIITFWPDNSAQIKKELKPNEAAKIYEMVVARKKELQVPEPGSEG